MSINEIKQLTHPYHLTSQRTQLKKGDIIRGKILQLMPNQTAKIQIGSQHVTARLEAPLVSGERYFFQVEQTSHPLHLKVMQMQEQSETTKSVQELLRQIDLTPTKEIVHLTNFLIKSQIPIQKQMITIASQLLAQSTNKPLTMDIIKQMIARHIPMKPSIFKALQSNALYHIDDLIKSVINQPKHSLIPIEEGLVTTLKYLTERPVTGLELLIDQIKTDIRTNDKHVFQLFKALGVINKETSFQKWLIEWTRFFSKEKPLSHIPFSLKDGKIFPKFDLIVQHKGDIQQTFQQIIQSDTSIDRISPPLPKIIQTLWTNIHKFSSSKQELQSILHMLTHDAVYDRLKVMTQIYKASNTFHSSSLKSRFLTHVNQTIDELGLAYEHQLISSGRMNSQTVKGLLLQIIESGIGNKELYQQLLNVMNGTQILSLHETNQMVNVSLQLPAEKLGLTGSMKVDISGKKKADGKLDEEFCRVLFYLNLTSLHMTVIDMFVQKRTISLTVYNDNTLISKIAPSFEGKLKVALNEIDYHLSNIAYKRFNDGNQKENKNTPLNIFSENLKGVDYRI